MTLHTDTGLDTERTERLLAERRGDTAPQPVDMGNGILQHCRAHQEAHAASWSDAEDAALRTAYARTELAKTRTFEQAMAIPAIARAVRCMAKSLQHTPGALFHEETSA